MRIFLYIVLVVLFSSFMTTSARDTVKAMQEVTLQQEETQEETQEVAQEETQTEEPESDTTEVKKVEEVETDADESTAEVVESETLWTLSTYLSAENKSVKKGVLTGRGKPVMEAGADLSYQDFSVSASGSMMSNPGLWSDYSLGLDYSHSFNDWFDLSLGYSYFAFLNDTLNPNSDNKNSLSLSTTFSYSGLSLDIGYERIFGALPVNSFSGTLSYGVSIGKFRLAAIADVTNSDYRKNATKKPSTLKKLLNTKSLTYLGVLSVKYQLPYGFDVGVSGSLASDYKGKLNSIARFRVGYTTEF